MQEWSESQHFIIYFDPTTMAIITKESENNGRHRAPAWAADHWDPLV